MIADGENLFAVATKQDIVVIAGKVLEKSSTALVQNNGCIADKSNSDK
jgi:hypothetical protein